MSLEHDRADVLPCYLHGSVAILMPAYNERDALARTLLALRAERDAFGGVSVFVVDDGSEPAIEPRDLPAPVPGFRIVLARHAVNLGQGAAIETARQLALRDRAERGDEVRAYVTMDADG